MKRETHEAWKMRNSTRRQRRGAPTDTALRRELNTAAEELKRLRDRTVCEFFEEYATKLEKRSRKGDIAGFHQHMKGVDVEKNGL